MDIVSRYLPERPHRIPGRAFTLIELLVVVAIIALLIAILLPSLSKARGQARTTLCASRIGQLDKAMLMYTDDFGEFPPFIGLTPGWDFPDTDRHIGSICDPNEDWLVRGPNSWDPQQWKDNFFRAWEQDWPVELHVPRSGTLFDYARFERVYACPEFERVQNPQKTQSVFNFTRPEWGRRFRVPPEWEPGGYANEGGWELVGDFKGPILRTSAIHSPGSLPILIDEQWDRHVARPPAMFESDDSHYKHHWMDTDPLMCSDDEVGRYHGTPAMESKYYDPEEPIERGNIAYYDGHVDLRRDPSPSANPCERDTYSDIFRKMAPCLKYLFEAIYAQRGLRSPMNIPDPPWF